jgi:hypothetical protein
MAHLQGYDVGTVVSAQAEIYGLGFSKPFLKDLDTRFRGYGASSGNDDEPSFPRKRKSMDLISRLLLKIWIPTLGITHLRGMTSL